MRKMFVFTYLILVCFVSTSIAAPQDNLRKTRDVEQVGEEENQPPSYRLPQGGPRLSLKQPKDVDRLVVSIKGAKESGRELTPQEITDIVYGITYVEWANPVSADIWSALRWELLPKLSREHRDQLLEAVLNWDHPERPLIIIALVEAKFEEIRIPAIPILAEASRPSTGLFATPKEVFSHIAPKRHRAVDILSKTQEDLNAIELLRSEAVRSRVPAEHHATLDRVIAGIEAVFAVPKFRALEAASNDQFIEKCRQLASSALDRLKTDHPWITYDTKQRETAQAKIKSTLKDLRSGRFDYYDPYEGHVSGFDSQKSTFLELGAEAIPGLCQELGRRRTSVEMRCFAAEVLGNIRDDIAVVKMLEEKIEGVNDEERQQALRVIEAGLIRPRVLALMQALDDEDDIVVAVAAESLGKMGPAARRSAGKFRDLFNSYYLSGAVFDGRISEDFLIRLARDFGRIGDLHTVPPAPIDSELLRFFPLYRVRAGFAAVLGERGDIENLSYALPHETTPQVRSAIIRALKGIEQQNPEAFSPAIAKLREALYSDPSCYKEDAADSLRQIAQVTSYLEDGAIDGLRGALRHKEKAIRTAAANALVDFVAEEMSDVVEFDEEPDALYVFTEEVLHRYPLARQFASTRENIFRIKSGLEEKWFRIEVRSHVAHQRKNFSNVYYYGIPGVDVAFEGEFPTDPLTGTAKDFKITRLDAERDFGVDVAGKDAVAAQGAVAEKLKERGVYPKPGPKNEQRFNQLAGYLAEAIGA